MSDNRESSYAYAVARIRAMEGNLLNKEYMELLLQANDADQCLQMLADKGWGDKSGTSDAEEMLSIEKAKTWEEVENLIEDKDALEVLNYPDLYHNLKAAVKDALTQGHFDLGFIPGTEPSGQQMRDIVLAQDYTALPGDMGAAAKEAYETLLHTRDGQLCDIIIDRACMEAIYEASKNSDEPVIQAYGKAIVDAANIKIAVRAQRTGKNIEFFRQAMVRTDSIDPEEAGKAAAGGQESLYDYLRRCQYSEAVEALEQSSSAFECWCDNMIIESLKPQLFQAFTMGPVVAYAIARDMEIKTVRIILTGKLNDFPEDAIRERIRETYV